jgi:cytidylate kinase
MDKKAAIAAALELDPEIMHDPAIRDQETGEAASLVAAIPEVRRALVNFQRDFASHPPGGAAGAVIDGRDIGTVVCPEAKVKLFITASDAERARRRMLELEARGGTHNYEDVLAEIQARDQRDTVRETAPLKKAEDALLLDTTNLDIEAAFKAALEIIESSRDGARGA